MLLFLIAFFLLNFTYRWILCSETNREFFELFCIYCRRFIDLVPIEFLTGFYVSQVVTRWWDMFMSLPFPDRLALKLATYIAGKVSWLNKCLQ